MERDRVFIALTRPQMFAGVTYGYFVANLILTTELFLIFKSPIVLVVAVIAHLAGVAMCASEPRIFDLLLTRARRCPRVANHSLWRCNSYRP